MISTQRLIDGAEKMGICLTREMAREMDRFAQLLVEWNEKMNLTAIIEPDAIVVKHFLDSLSLLTEVTAEPGAKLIDVGTGAGFPAVPLKIVRRDLDVTLLDSLRKRLDFLQAVCEDLSLPMRRLHLRAEEGARREELRETFDLATARAVAPLPALCEYCLPYVKTGGRFVAMKGPDCKQELAQAQHAIRALGGTVERAAGKTLEDGSGRTIIVIRKTRSTPACYPRHGAAIAKNPL